jgi:hypothetical protein
MLLNGPSIGAITSWSQVHATIPRSGFRRRLLQQPECTMISESKVFQAPDVQEESELEKSELKRRARGK